MVKLLARETSLTLDFSFFQIRCFFLRMCQCRFFIARFHPLRLALLYRYSRCSSGVTLVSRNYSVSPPRDYRRIVRSCDRSDPIPFVLLFSNGFTSCRLRVAFSLSTVPALLHKDPLEKSDFVGNPRVSGLNFHSLGNSSPSFRFST